MKRQPAKRWTIPAGTIACLVLAGAVSAQATPPPQEAERQNEPKAPYTDAKVRAWEWQARAAIRNRGLSEEIGSKVLTYSVDSRKRHAEGVAGLREEWIQQSEERLRQIREGGGGGSLFDRSDLERSIAAYTERERTKLAKELVRIMDRPLAAEVYPPLALYDAKVDGLVSLTVEMGLDDERTFAAVAVIQHWHITTMHERSRPRQDRPLALENMKLERERLLDTMREMLDADQFALFERGMRRTKPVDE